MSIQKTIVKEAEKLSYIAFAIETGNMPAFSGVERFIDSSSDAARSQAFRLPGFKNFT